MAKCFSFTASRNSCYRHSFANAGLRSETTDLGDGTVMHCWVPKNRNQNKPILILIHGFGANAMWQWGEFLRPLIRRFNIYVPDLLFFGESFTTRPERTESFQAQCVMRVMEAHGVSKMNVIGISYGGFVGYSLAVQFPDAVERLVLLCAGVCLEEKDLGEGLFMVSDLDEASSILLPQTPQKLKQLMRFSFVKPVNGLPSCFFSDFIQVMCTKNGFTHLLGEMEEQGCNGELETNKADRAVWLMKCPPVVSRSWQSQSAIESVRPVAKVVLSVDPLHPNDDSSSAQFTMELAGAEAGNVPKCYSLDMSKDFIPMCVFSETNQGKISVEGKVLNKFDMKPHNENIGDYGKLCRERTSKYMTKSRQIRVIDDDRGVHMRPMPGMLMLASGSKDKKKIIPMKGSDMKRTRRDRGEMEEIMFKLFERQPNWTLRQLIQETDQPEQFLKDILKDLCVYNNKGTNQGTYQLKPEYKRSDEEEVPQ